MQEIVITSEVDDRVWIDVRLESGGIKFGVLFGVYFLLFLFFHFASLLIDDRGLSLRSLRGNEKYSL